MTIRLRIFALLTAMPLFAGCVTRSSTLVLEDQQLQAALLNQYETQTAINSEAGTLMAALGRAKRNQGLMALTLTNGQSVTLRNEDSGCPHPPNWKLQDERCFTYVLMAYLPSEHLFLVGQFQYEGGNYFLIDDRSGRRTDVAAVPQFSPDHAHFIVIDNNEAGGDTGLVQVWVRKGDTAEIEWHHQFAGWPITLSSWTAKHIELDIDFPPRYRNLPDVHYPATLTEDNSGWHLETRAPEAKKPNS